MPDFNRNVTEPRLPPGEIPALDELDSNAPGTVTPMQSAPWHQLLWSHQFLRFLIVGLGNTAVGYLLYLTGLGVGLSYTAALTCSTTLGTMFNFFSTGKIVFKNKSLIRIFGFFAVYGFTFGVNLALLTLLVEHGMAKAYAQLSLLPVNAMLSFALMKFVVFGRR